MNGERAFFDALDAALDAVRGGAPVASVAERYPEHAAALLPLLRLGASFRAEAPMPSPRLGQHMREVRLALHAERERRRAPWWRRPVSFASASVPAGLLALALVGGSAAAAGGAAVVATQTDLPHVVEKVATLDFGDGNAENAPGHGGDLPGVPGGPADAGNRAATPRPDTGRPTPISVSGTISRVRGNAFTLTTPDGEWSVNLDAASLVTGVIADGATATVDGDQTGDRNLHAAHVTVTTGAAALATPTSPGNSSGEATPPGQSRTPERRGAPRTPGAGMPPNTENQNR